MKLVEYDSRYKFPISLNLPGRIQSMSIDNAQKLYKELGEILKKIPPEDHEPIRFGPSEKGE